MTMMKRFFALSFVAALFVMCQFLVACGDDDNNNGAEQPQVPELTINLTIAQTPAIDFTKSVDQSVSIFTPSLSLSSEDAQLNRYEVTFSNEKILNADAQGHVTASDLKDVFESIFGADAVGQKELPVSVVAVVDYDGKSELSSSVSTKVLVRLNAASYATAENVGRKDIMLQGFYWDSQKVTGWSQMLSHVEDVAKQFTCIWLPPSASAEGNATVGGNNVGYHPRIWNDQNSCWGTADDLKTLNAKFHEAGVKVIADIVINHRAGYTDWCNFPVDDFGSFGSFQLTGEHVCSDDETNTGHKADDAWGAKDTGDKWDGARDLDHTNEYLQKDIIAYLSWLKAEMGYDGFRYDLVKGYEGKYVGIYNEATDPYLSVGECWDGNYDVVASWINATGKKSMAFDFPAKYAIFNDGLAQSNYSKMTWKEKDVDRPAGMIHNAEYRPYSVTFVDNHDTYRDNSKYTGDVPMAYAVLLASPGIPCVFWPHWTSDADAINGQIAVRKLVGIGAESPCEVTSSGTCYESLTIGENGSLVCRVGKRASSEAPEGYVLSCSGTGWYYFISENLAE